MFGDHFFLTGCASNGAKITAEVTLCDGAASITFTNESGARLGYSIGPGFYGMTVFTRLMDLINASTESEGQ